MSVLNPVRQNHSDINGPAESRTRVSNSFSPVLVTCLVAASCSTWPRAGDGRGFNRVLIRSCITTGSPFFRRPLGNIGQGFESLLPAYAKKASPALCHQFPVRGDHPLVAGRPIAVRLRPAVADQGIE